MISCVIGQRNEGGAELSILFVSGGVSRSTLNTNESPRLFCLSLSLQSINYECA
jgi:hypothetical protein